MKLVLRLPERKEVEVKGDRPLKEILLELGLNPETVVVIRGEELLTLDERVGEGETLEVLSAVSGGWGESGHGV
ncbi:MoaD/ThiS family protein [Thermus sp. PS18]|uniref:sulfur carrier protein ThiS n=1 Tax=Thermus sp. PS18 TaxID=2849039 RepID=UPI0022644BF2|nr:MoaD/ThiS family protein [Thermus sp. PS18]UZX15398.1 MoaD/ThiS family protein [Thermus sp. PS18]